MSSVVVKPGHVQPLWAGHPWVYAQAVQRIAGGATPGDEVDVLDAQGKHLGRGLYSPGSAIAVRLFTRGHQHLDGGLLRQRLEVARHLREQLDIPRADTNAYRLMHAEGDDLPALIVDVYGDVLVVQIGTVGMHERLRSIVHVLVEQLAPRSIVDRSSQKAAKLEGFSVDNPLLHGTHVEELTFRELGLEYRLPIELSQKTGYYLDLRPLRARVRRLAQGKRVLDTYSFIGGLALNAAQGGAESVVAVDSSALALEVGAECALQNGLGDKVRYERGDARQFLHDAAKDGGYDLVICDPPKLAPSRANRKRAQDAMRRIAKLACSATRPGGVLVLCSCSAALGLDGLTRALALGGRDAGTLPVVFERVFQGADHPVMAAFPEGLYLTAVIARVMTRAA